MAEQQLADDSRTHDWNRTNINNLSNDVMVQIFNHLSVTEKVKLESVNKRWRMLSLTSMQSAKSLILDESTRCFEKVIDYHVKYCPNLQVIDLKHYRISSDSVQQLIKKCTSIESMTIGSTTNDCEEELTELCKTHKQLKELHIANNEYFSGNCLKYANALEKLTIQSCPAFDSAIKSQLPTYCPNLRAVSFDQSGPSIDTLLSKYTRLQSLSLFASPSCGLKLIELCRNNSELTELKVAGSFPFTQFNLESVKNVESLGVLSAKLHITMRFGMLENLTHLSLVDVSVDPSEDETAIGNMLQNLTRLCFLRIEKSNFLDNHLAKVIFDNCPMLENVVLSDSIYFDDQGLKVILDLPLLKNLELARLTRVMGYSFMKSVPNLEELKLTGWDHLRFFGLSRLVLLSPKFKCLWMSQCDTLSYLQTVIRDFEFPVRKRNTLKLTLRITEPLPHNGKLETRDIVIGDEDMP